MVKSPVPVKLKLIVSAPSVVKEMVPSAVMAPMFVRSPVVLTPQSEVLICIVSPPSPKRTAPPGVRVKAPVVVKVVEAPSKAISVSAIDTCPSASKAPVMVPNTSIFPLPSKERT